jgi:hypothetical protein
MLNGNHVHRTAAHAAVEKPVQSVGPHFSRLDPVVVGTGFVASRAADEGAIFHPRDVIGVGAREKAARTFFRIQPSQGAGAHHLVAQTVVLRLRAVAPVNLVRLG